MQIHHFQIGDLRRDVLFEILSANLPIPNFQRYASVFRKKMLSRFLTKEHSMKLLHLFPIIALLPLSFTSVSMAQDTAVGELVTNPGFEAVEMGAPTGWGLNAFVTTLSPIANTGAHSLKIEVQDEGYQPFAAQSIFGYKNDQLHRLQYNVRTDRFGVEYRLYTEFWDSKLGWVSVSNGDWRQGSGTWQQVSVDLMTPHQSDRLLIVLQVKGPGTAWFDNVSIKPVNPVAKETTPAPAAPVVVAPPVRTVAAGDRGVKITPDRRFMKDGRPFFPIQIWGWWPYSDEMLKEAHDFGYNIVGAPGFKDSGPTAARLWLDAAQRNGLSAMVAMGYNLPPNDTAEAVLAAINEGNQKIMPVLRDHPAVFGYNINDEPAWGGYDVATHNKAAQWLKAQDPLHPIFINHAPQNSIEEIKRYNSFIDISGSDIYPVRHDGIGLHSSLPNKSLSVVGDETRKNLEAVDYKKPVMETLQAFSWSAGQSGDTLFPTRHQSRFMAWDSIVAGATGITWFQDERYPYLHPDIKPIVREFAALQDVLAGGKAVATKGVFASPIQSIAYEWKGKTVLIATNPTDKSVNLAANWKPVFANAKAPLRVLWENRSSAATETFKPYDVHIYTDAAKDEDILRTEFTVDPIAP
jgi:hypothetical protein